MYAGRIVEAHHARGVFFGRVVFVCWLQYILDLAVPEAQWIKPEFANGEHVDWLRICGWMATRRPPPPLPPPPYPPPPPRTPQLFVASPRPL